MYILSTSYSLNVIVNIFMTLETKLKSLQETNSEQDLAALQRTLKLHHASALTMLDSSLRRLTYD